MAQAPLVHLIDGHIYIFRAYFSLPSMEAPDGNPTGAAYGFANTLLRFIREHRVEYIGVAFDHAMTSFRNEVEPGYKADRGEPDAELEAQFGLCRDVCEALGIPSYERENFEADDVIATLSQQLVRKRARVSVVTGDKDLSQLVREDGRVVLHDLAREKTYDADAVREKFGVAPHQIPDYLGLVGDAVDCLPGVPGVGPKSASAVLQEFGDLDRIPESLEGWDGLELRGKARIATAVAKNRDRALLTRELATLRYDVPGVSASLRELRYRGSDRDIAWKLFDRLGWGRIATRIDRWK